MTTGALSLSLLVMAAAMSVCAPRASAQSVYGYSSVSIGFGEVTSDSETDLDYFAELYYDVETDAWLWANSSIAVSGSSSGSSGQSVSLETSTAINTNYYVQTNHWVIPFAETPYCFGCVGGEGWAGSMSVTAPPGSDSGSVYVGTTYDSGSTYGSAPGISGADYTTYGTEMPGTSGYVILYGSNFTTPYGSTTVSSTFGSPSYVSETQINLYYSIPAGTASATLTGNIDVSVASVGDAYANFYVYDPQPTITSVSPSTWNAGSGGTVTISGYYFGSSSSVSLSGDLYATLTKISQSGEDGTGYGTITATYRVTSSDPGYSATLAVSASSYSGSGFYDPAVGVTAIASIPVGIAPLPTITGMSGGAFSAGNTYPSVIITGTNFGSPGSVPVDSGTFTPTSWGSSIVGTLVIPQSDTNTTLQFTVAPGSGPQSSQYGVTLGCGDIRNTETYEYWANPAITLHPACSDFTQTSPSADFPSFGTLNSSRQSPYAATSTQYPWAILTSSLGSGIDGVYAYSPIAMTIDSGYRNPSRQAVVTGGLYPNDSHTQGLAVDIVTSSEALWIQLSNAVFVNRPTGGPPCVEPYSVQHNYNHVHLDWRSACPAGW